MMKRLLFIISVLIPLFTFSQQESYYSLYRYNMNVINPAYAGALGKNVFAFTSRRQWSSMQDAPSTLAFSYSSERANNVGLGLSVVSIGGFDIGYAYETPTVSSLSQLNLKTHEIVLRINLGQGDQTTKTGQERQQ